MSQGRSFPLDPEPSFIHQAGPVTDDGQLCARCGQVLVRTNNVGWRVGSKVLTKGRMSIQCADIVPADCVATEDDGA